MSALVRELTAGTYFSKLHDSLIAARKIAMNSRQQNVQGETVTHHNWVSAFTGTDTIDSAMAQIVSFLRDMTKRAHPKGISLADCLKIFEASLREKCLYDFSP